MGNGASFLVKTFRNHAGKPGETNATEEHDSFALTLDDVSRLHNCYRDGYYDFGLAEEAIQQLLAEASWKKQITAKKLNELFDPEGVGMVNALEMIATLAVMSTANITEKAHLVFQVFDLQTQGELTYDETVVMLICTLSGLVKVVKPINGIRYPEDSEMEKVADEIFMSADRDVGANLPLASFTVWVQKRFSPARSKELQIYDVLTSFGLTSGEDQVQGKTEDEADAEQPLFEEPTEGKLEQAGGENDEPTETAAT